MINIKHNKLILISLLLIIALLFMQGCKKEEIIAEETLPVVNDITFTTYNQFALELLKNSRQAEENIIISPISIGITLTMLRMGAKNATAEGIDNTLGMTYPDFDAATAQCAEIVDRLNELKGLWYETGSGLFIDEGPSIKESYAVSIENNFDILIKFMNFNSDRAEIEINDWGDEATSGRVTELVRIDELPEDLLTLLINVNALDSIWEMEFDPDNTRLMPFGISESKGVAAPTMRGKMNMKLYEDEDVTAGFLPMDGGQTLFAIIMPPEDVPLEIFLDTLSADDIELWRLIAADVNHFINMPKIDWYQVKSFKEPLSKMGAGDMFDKSLADFSNMGDGFYLGDIWQTTIVRAIENGAKPSDITAIDLTRARGNGEYFFSVNRPFLFAAIDNQTGGILMIGTMANPLR